MESLLENRPLLYSLAGAGGFVVMLALGRFSHPQNKRFVQLDIRMRLNNVFPGWLPEFSNQFSIVDFSDEFRAVLLQVLVIDAAAAFLLDRALLWLAGEGKLNIRQ